MFKITIISVGSMKEKYFADYSLENTRFSSGWGRKSRDSLTVRDH